MPGEMSIAEYYSVGCRPYDADGAAASLLERAMRAFFTRGGTGGTVRTVENGREVRTRYRLGPKRFHWKKTSGGVTLQEAFAVRGGEFRLVAHDFSGRLLSALTFGAGLRWLRTAYYDGDPADPAAVLRRGEEGLFLLRRGGEEVLLLPCPWAPGTAAQSYVNAREGEPLVTARTDAGDFCFCAEEECARRIALREEAVSRTSPTLGETGGETLEFRVVPNAPGGLSPAPALPDGAGSAPVLSRQTKLPVPSAPAAGACVQAQPAGACVQAQPAGGYAADREIVLGAEAPARGSVKIEVEPPPEPGRGGLPAQTPRRPSGKYAVAAKGLAGGVRLSGAGAARLRPGAADGGAPVPSAPAAGACVQAQPAAAKQASPVPVKRIVVSSMESYLYFGRLLAGLRQGRGRTAMPDGRTAYEGGYRDDMREGFGVYYCKTGELCYAGEWKHNLRDGLGVAFGAKDGTVFVGHWQGGAATGTGTEFDTRGRLAYTGGWKNGRRHGYGTEYRDGRVWRSGMWRDDVFCPGASPAAPPPAP